MTRLLLAMMYYIIIHPFNAFNPIFIFIGFHEPFFLTIKNIAAHLRRGNESSVQFDVAGGAQSEYQSGSLAADQSASPARSGLFGRGRPRVLRHARHEPAVAQPLTATPSRSILFKTRYVTHSP